MTERKKLKPLGFFGAILLPIALLFLRGEAARSTPSGDP